MVRNESKAASHVLRGLQMPGGGYAMLALDQRESMRDMFSRDATGAAVGDAKLREFKQLGIDVLTPYASAVLLDRPYAVDGVRPANIAEGCGLIVAVDVLHQVVGEQITDVTIDPLVTVDLLQSVGADAIKLLVLWHPASGARERAALVQSAVDLAEAAGVASLIEGIVRPEPGTSWSSPAERHQAILDCAAELVQFAPDIYKAEVPGYVVDDVSSVAEQSAAMSEIVRGDWVVLSNGVQRDQFSAAVTEALAGGASGFLAGRAIWADTVDEPDVRAALEARAVDRLTALAQIVDARTDRP